MLSIESIRKIYGQMDARRDDYELDGNRMERQMVGWSESRFRDPRWKESDQAGILIDDSWLNGKILGKLMDEIGIF